MEVPDVIMEEEEEEETPDLVQCCICLDLMYKPVVLSEEKKKDCFSPQFFGDAPGSNANIGCDGLRGCSSAAGGECLSSLDDQALCKGEARPRVLQSSSKLSTKWTKCSNSSERIHYENKNLPQSTNNGKQLSVPDVLCAACKQMLYRPVALNCGHAYCEACIPNQVNETLRCQVCHCCHPSGHPKVCLEFHHFLEMQFPKEHALRSECVSTDHRDVKTDSSGICSATDANNGAPIRSAATWEPGLQQSDPSLMVHGVGCDYCGVIPIVGDRYKCKDCVERIGFNLCRDCYYAHRANLPGRFNQQHTPEHRFEQMENNIHWDHVSW